MNMKKTFKEKEPIEILKPLGLINNIEKYQDIYIHNVMHNSANNQGLYNNLSDPDIISIAKFKTHQLQVHAHLWQ